MPEAYGFMATAMSVLVIVTLITDVGLRTVAITSPNLQDPDFVSTIWSFQALRGITLSCVIYGISSVWEIVQSKIDLGESAFAEPIIPSLIAVMGVNLLISGLHNAGEYVLAKEAIQRPLVIVDLSSKIFGSVTTIVLVASSKSVWGMVFGTLAASVLRAALSHVALGLPKARICWRREYVQEILSAGKWMAAHSWATGIGGIADKLIIGAFFDARTLGLYSLAWNLFDAAYQIIDRAYQQMGLPTLYRIAHLCGDEIKRKLTIYALPGYAFGLLAAGVLTLGGTLLVGILYDHRYAEAGKILSALGICFLLFPLGLPESLFFARRQFARSAALNGLRVAVLYAFLASGAMIGKIEMVALGFSLHRLPDILLSNQILIAEGSVGKLDFFAKLALVGIIGLTLTRAVGII
jgi:O-antigen/teichoic acid export membrane protein